MNANPTQFTAYALLSGGYASGLTVDHVYVVAEDHNWNCFGRGAAQSPPGRLIAQGMGNALWASLIYDPKSEGKDNQCLATGITEKYEGVCHTVANRILVLCGDDLDSRKATGNELATVMYGKFGFNLESYIASVKQAAAEANSRQPGAVSPEDVETVVNRILRGYKPDQEMELLRADLEEQFQIHFDSFTASQRDDFIGTYTDFQAKRKAAFDAEPKGNSQDFQPRFAKRLMPDLKVYLSQVQRLLGPEQYAKIFMLAPKEATQFLLGY